MLRDIITIDEEKCDGCGECIPACKEGALRIIDGKARLVANNVCDGMGACLGHCPRGAITVVRRDVDAFDPAAVQKNLQHPSTPRRLPTHSPHSPTAAPGGCPGSRAVSLRGASSQPVLGDAPEPSSQLMSWPVKLHLVNPRAPYLQGARLLVAADCVPVAYGAFQSRMLKGRIPVIACPKFDDLEQHVDKLTAIFALNHVTEVAVVRMVVPCCTGIVTAVREALLRSQAQIPMTEIIVSLEGDILSEQTLALAG